MSHPFSENSLSSTVAHAKHVIALQEKQKEKTSKDVAHTLQQSHSSEMELMQKIVNAIPENVWDKNIPVVLAEKKKENTGGGWEKAVGDLQYLHFDPTQLHLVDARGNQFQVKRGHTYAICRIGTDKSVTIVEIEIPRDGAMIPADAMFSRNGESNEDIQEIVEKYDLRHNALAA